MLLTLQIIAVFILGIGIGSLVCRWIVNRVSAPLALFGFLQLGIGLSSLYRKLEELGIGKTNAEKEQTA